MDHHWIIFVCGLQRSGTTMLYRFLGEHPLMSALSGTERPANEGQHNQTVYPGDTYHSKAGRFAFRADARFTEESPLVTPENRERLFREWSRYWDLDKPFLVEKSPPNLIRTRFLQAMFERSFFVVLLRHPIVVSLATRKWDPKTRPHALVSHWLRAHELLLRDVPYIKRLHVMRYEDLVADPDRELGRLFAFLGVDDPCQGRQRAPGVNDDNFESDRRVRVDSNEQYFRAWESADRNIGQRVYRNAIARRFEKRARMFGYSLRRLRTLSTPAAMLPGLSREHDGPGAS